LTLTLIAASKTLNVELTTSDNLTLGAWFVLSDEFYRALPMTPSPVVLEEGVYAALKSHPTILFLHGNGQTRAFAYRVNIYTGLSSRLNANVFAVDYRGFADSQGTPSESGVALDARAAWDWVIESGADPKNVLLVGHSLGSAIIAKLAAQLSAENVPFRGLVLMSPFSSVKKLLETHTLFGVLPLMQPLMMIPGAFGKHDVMMFKG
jgi:abhydrolase domain-containing protein 12